ncbi:MAG: single-stranded DNA-binding protein [Acidilobaceae archaeon]
MDSVNVKVRVLEAGESKVIETRSGPRTISEAVVGDESGRVRLTLWGKLAGTIKKGETVEIRNAWTTTYRGQVQLNVGARGSIVRIPSGEVAEEENIPEETPKPKTPQPQRPRTGPPREGGRPQRGFRPRR